MAHNAAQMPILRRKDNTTFSWPRLVGFRLVGIIMHSSSALRRALVDRKLVDLNRTLLRIAGRVVELDVAKVAELVGIPALGRVFLSARVVEAFHSVVLLAGLLYSKDKSTGANFTSDSLDK